MSRRGLPKRQRLIGLWLLLSGISLLGGTIFATWLDTRLAPSGLARLTLWLGSFSGGATIFLVGLVLERRLFTPLRQLQAQLARLVANPDARDDHPPKGWLKSLEPDLRRAHDYWREDRRRLATAHTEGARSAARIRKELETLLQLLETPLILCDHHRRLMLYNQAAEEFFNGNTGLGLGKRLESLLPNSSLQHTLNQLPQDGAPREWLTACDNRWLKIILRRVPDRHGEILLTFSDATASWSNEMGARAQLADMLIPLRQHSASLICAADALSQLPPKSNANDDLLRQRLERMIQEEGAILGDNVARIGSLLDDMQQQGERLTPLWSNDFWQALDERLDPEHRLITPVGVPTWFKGDAPALMAMFDSLVKHLNTHLPDNGFEGEISQGNKYIYLDLIWRGKALTEHALSQWRQHQLASLPLMPKVADVLRQHASEVWSLNDADGIHARLRLPLPAMEREGAPREAAPPRPEFHDFGIADLPPPDEALAGRPLRSLDIVSFDTETTGLELRRGDMVISLGACRIVNARLLASDVFDQKVDPQRPIPAASTAIHGINDADVKGAPTLDSVLPRFLDYVGEAVLLAHNADFDLLAISQKGIDLELPVIDTLLISRALDEALEGHDLDSLAQRYDLTFPPGTRHTALGDAQVTAELWLALLPRLEARGIDSFEQLLALQASAVDRQDANAK